MEIKKVRFVTSAPDLKAMPTPTLPEYAFVGRSNVGKSSLINALCKRKDLAHTSSTPGKTRTVNHFIVDESWFLADLPGYGFAKVSKTERGKFSVMIKDYVLRRENLMTVFVLVDSRLKPQAIDLEFITLLGEKGIPLAIVFTKMDKLSQREIQTNVKEFEKALGEIWEELPLRFGTSAETGKGMQELLQYIRETNPLFRADEQSD